MPEKLDQATNLSSITMVAEPAPATRQDAETFENTLNILGEAEARLVSELTPEDLAGLPKNVQRALSYSGSIIIDAGKGIDALLYGVSEDDQTFSTLEVDQALIDSGLIQPNSRVIKMGPAGAIVQDEHGHKHGAEVIETTVIDTRQEVARIAALTKAAWNDDEKKLHVTNLKKPERIILENQFIAQKQPLENSKGIFVEIDVEQAEDPANLYALISSAAEQAGFEHYTVRGTTKGHIKTLNSVAKELPTHEINSMAELAEYLIDQINETDSDYHFIGTRSDAKSRRSEKLKKLSKNPIYAPTGHIHGHSEDRTIGGHGKALFAEQGTKIYLIIEPAKVVQVD